MAVNKYSIRFTPKAYEDLDGIYGYIANDIYIEGAANSLMEKIEISIMRLREFPFSCSYVRDEILNVKGYRKLIVESYIVFHLVREEEKQVVIMRILYGKQKYQDLI